MFNESWPWKRDLALAAERLDDARLGLPSELVRVSHAGAGAEDLDAWEVETQALYQVERDVMLGAFAVRRLVGMPSKVTKRTRETKATVTRFPLCAGAKSPDIVDILADLHLYDMGAPKVQVITANELCNLFIHSWVLRFAWTLQGMSFTDWCSLEQDDPRTEALPTELAGWLVATDKSSEHHLTLVPLPELVRVMRIFAADDVTELLGRRDSRGRMHLTGK